MAILGSLTLDFERGRRLWKAAAPRPVLDHDDVHVWRARFDDRCDPLIALRTLSEDELRRAGRYRFERDRRRFVLRRALLRTILGRYTQTPPERLLFRAGVERKPALADHSNLQFSVSSSGDLALCAVASSRPVGVDIELLEPNPWCLALAERLFAPCEVAELRTLPPSVQSVAFYQYWTRKEAYLKAIGAGLSRPLDSFEVSRRVDERPVPIHDSTNGREADRWSLVEVMPASAYVGAIASVGDDWNLSCWETPPLPE